MRIIATERRRRPLTDGEWAALDGNEAFWRLVESGFVAVAQTGATKHELRGQRYVGRAVAGGIELVIEEKVRGTLAALLAFASGSEIVVARAESGAAEFDAVSRVLIQEFVRVAGDYIAHRRVANYEYRQAAGASLGGTLDVARTMQLHARGSQHLVAYTRGSVVRNTNLDKVTLAALEEIDRAGAALGLPKETMYNARWLAGALEEVRDDDYQSLARESFLDAADDIASVVDELDANRDLARLATVVLLHRGFEWTAAATDRVPRAWFIDLESLFEHAVRTKLQEVMAPVKVDRGEGFDRRLFVGGCDSSRVNPDVVAHDSGSLVFAADVKYKSLNADLSGGEIGDSEVDPQRRKKPGRSDLYQLLVHAAALHAPKVMLIYPADAVYRARYLGTATTRAETWVFEVRPLALDEDLRAAIIAVAS